MDDLPVSKAREISSPASATIILSVSVASAIWLFAGVVLMGYLAKSPVSCTGTFSCLTLDGWGTYLSGVFAPLAFFWLVATVWIQSRELGEQRQELALTRKEFEHNREVMKAQSDYVGAQTDIVIRDQADHELLMLFRLFRTWARSSLHKSEAHAPGVDIGAFTRDTPDDPIDFVVDVSARLSRPIFMLLVFGDDTGLDDFKHLTRENVVELAEHFERMFKMRSRVSPANSALLAQLMSSVTTKEIREVATRLPSIVDQIDNFGVLFPGNSHS
ncbi:hypothetical protein E0H47_23105 [Rhizobium leguminosarum bv. viciae]|uniref:hypothetical protein n=1 Tax=Rhizobium leguminosarum TaxID=384 RepID=UPI00103A15D4|nr:hypothetical protein [Rhizobium leguminosarum]TBZ36587.1 hypothetical protein E0H47_23105 [Rhizobium leguminosarum bv. viciae]